MDKYKTALERLYDLAKLGIKPGLDNIKKAVGLLNPNTDNIYIIQIAGTNGKGTVSHILEQSFIESGYSTALFTSPHLNRFTQRIKIDGKEIEKNMCTRLINETLDTLEKNELQLTFFEAVTTMALKYFCDNKVKIIVLEAGLGGRLDATSVVTPSITAITSIGLDHTDFLGDTISKIAFEKAGIAKKGVPLYCGRLEEDAADVIKSNAYNVKAPLFILGRDFEIDKSLTIPWPGIHQRENATLAKEIFLNYPHNFSKSSAEKIYQKALLKTKLEGRFEKLFSLPVWIIDGAHNIEAISALVKTLKDEKIVPDEIIFGALKNKPFHEMLSLLKKCSHNISIVNPDVPRTFDGEKIAAENNLKFYDSVNSAIESIKSKSTIKNTPCKTVLVTGSFFIAAEARSILLKIKNDPKIAM
ncbi:MAG: bifunctional folylpolyglutamate synthase/dihydrofolate synthase [Deltaproteobacteria bacterium]|nr:bifunctional folylpolyglutamate synthase/dihydrofolate synthase [Deltaproteobacteria bacterium]